MKIKIKLPWEDRVPSRRKLQEEEMWELIDIMRLHGPDEEEYKNAFAAYERLHKLEMEEAKLRTFKWAELVKLFGSAGLTVGILTHELWTPLTSTAKSMALNQFKGGNNNNLLGM